MLNENAVKLPKSGLWDLATCVDGEPNVVPVAFKDVTPEGKLVVGDVFLDTTLKNIAANHGKIAVSVYDAQSLEGYQVKGTARYITEGAVVNTFKAMVEKMFNGAATGDNAAKALPYKRKKDCGSRRSPFFVFFRFDCYLRPSPPQQRYPCRRRCTGWPGPSWPRDASSSRG